MTTSSSYDFSLNARQIIAEALELIGELPAGENPKPEDEVTCLRTLNQMIKAWQAEEIYLWKYVEAALFLEYNGYSYDIGPSGDNITSSWVKTEIAVAADSGDLTITVDSDDGISDGDYIGIELDDGTLQWTTVNGVPAADVVTITAALTDDVAIDNHVYTYTTKLQRPLGITEARIRNASGYERPILIKSRDEYLRLPNKESTGSANQVYYDNKLTNGKLFVWPACGDVKEYIKFTAKIPIEDFDSATNDPDFPQEWLMALSWNLATLIAPKFGKSLEDKFDLRAIAFKQNLVDFDREQTSIFFGLE
jgi:hypothetical protein